MKGLEGGVISTKAIVKRYAPIDPENQERKIMLATNHEMPNGAKGVSIFIVSPYI